MDLKKLSVEELARKISPGSDVHNELRRRNVLRTKNTTGELGEYGDWFDILKYHIIPFLFGLLFLFLGYRLFKEVKEEN